MTFRVPRAGNLLLLLLTACASNASAPRAVRTHAAATFDVEHYALDLALDPRARTLEGSCRIRLWPAGAELREVELDLVALEVRSVRDFSGRELEFEQDEDSVRVRLADAVPKGTFAELTLRYGGSPAKGLFFVAERDGVPTQAWTHGECVDARGWFPCQDEPWERATSDLVVRVPAAWSVIAAGERIERVEDGGTAVERWHTSFPHPAYLETLVAGELAVEESQWDGIPLVFAADPALKEHLSATFADTDEILAFFSDVTGARYPYPKYAQVAVDSFPWGGMENLSATTLVDAAVTNAAGLADAPATGLVAHEAAHQWFGDLLTCADWSHAWLNEGFATYFGDLYAEHARGRDAFLLAMEGHRAHWLSRDAGPNRRPMVFVADGDPILSFLSGHAYDGGAIRLQHLRRLLGDDAFFRGVRLYVGENAGRGVVTDDLRRALEKASGRDLREHFARWFESPGHPRVEFAATWSAAKREIAVDVEQLQEDAPFPCLVEVEVADSTGVRVERMELEGRSERFVIAQQSEPRWVRLDPFCALPAVIVESRTFDAWLALLRDGPDAAARTAAAAFLAGRTSATEDPALRARIGAALVEALGRETSDEARLKVLAAVAAMPEGAIAPDVRRAALLARAKDDASPAVRAAALRALEPKAADPELALVARAELARAASFASTGAALGLLVRAEPGDALGRLSRELRVASPHGQRAARVAAEIARLREPEPTALLREVAADAALPDAPRRVAIAELGTRAKDDAKSRATLLALLESPRPNLRRDAVHALDDAMTGEVRAAFEKRLAVTLDGRERAAIERALATAP